MTDFDTYETRTDVTVGDATFPHVVATETREDRAVAVADRETRKHGRSYYVVRVTETRVYSTELDAKPTRYTYYLNAINRQGEWETLSEHPTRHDARDEMDRRAETVDFRLLRIERHPR